MIEAKVFATFEEGFRASFEDELRGEGFFCIAGRLGPNPSSCRGVAQDAGD